MPPAPDNYSSIKERIVEACVEFFALDGKPFDTVTGEGFINLAKQLMNAGASIGTGFSVNDLLPHSTTVSRNVDRVYARLKDQLILLCQNVQHFALTCDFWTEPYTGMYSYVLKSSSLHYGGISLHFVNSDFYLRIFILACKLYDLPNQKAYNIRDFVNTTLEEFSLKLNEEIFVVSDNEPKMVCVFKDDATRVGCSAHYINKALEHAFKLDESLCTGVQKLFLIVQDIISYIRQSHKQSSLSVCVQNYCKIRFSTVYIMLNTFLMIYNELTSVLNNNQRQKFLKINYIELEQPTKYLKHFHDVLEKLCCEQTPILHLVIPYKQLLINRSSENDDAHQNLIQLKRYLSEHLKDYWIIQEIHYVAMLLHPNLKSFYLIPNEIFDASNDENYLQTQPMEKTELDLYLEDVTRIDNNTNVLSYWNSNKSLYPNLAQIAKRILSIPATNTSVERLFSHSGNTVTNRRRRLDADKVNNLLFIKRNLRALKEIYPLAIEQSTKRKSSLISTDSTSSTMPNKKIKLMTEYQDVNETTSDEENDDEQALDKSLNASYFFPFFCYLVKILTYLLEIKKFKYTTRFHI
ncbi:unnamed protein product [Rotaria sp. Silwood2]|nr:unnamed protein product [Rotaria sp. Silwood2]CAF4240538.1 unnamed protein product [Rotaria sp. Silwood2]CAF4293517.1 unnamed protein product [Rotaria sp. Silwood2]